MAVLKTISWRSRSARQVLEVLRTRRDIIVAGFSALFGAVVAQGLAQLLDAMTKRLGDAHQRLIDTAAALEAERADDRVLRERLLEKVSAHRAVFIELREVVELFFGSGSAEQLGIKGTLSTVPVDLVRLTEVVTVQLDRWAPPKSRLTGVSFDPKAWSRRVRTASDELAKAMRDVTADGRENENALIAKDKEVLAFDEVFAQTGSLVAALLEFIGEKELARRTRPSARHPGRTIGDVEESGEEATEAA